MSNSVFPTSSSALTATTPVTAASPNSVSHHSATAVGEIDYVKLAWTYKVWLAWSLLLGLIAGHFVYKQLGPEYVATSKVLVSKNAGVSFREDEASASGDRGQHIALIMSPLIVERAVELHDLRSLPSMARSKDVVEDIVEDLKVQRSAGEDRSVLNVLDITYKNPSRTDAKKVVDAIIDAYRNFLKESHAENMSDLVTLVDKANVNLRSQIEEAEKQYERFRGDSPIHLKQPIRGPNGERLTVSSNVHQENLEALDKERQTLLLRKAELQSQIQSFETAVASGRSREELTASIQLLIPGSHTGTETNVLLNPTLERTNPETSDSQWLGLKLQEEKLLLEYGTEWPEVQSIRKQLAVIEHHYRVKGVKLPFEPNAPVAAALPGAQFVAQQPKLDLVGAYVFSLRQQLDALLRREQEIARVYSAEYDNARKLGRFVEQDRRFNEDIDRLNGMWNTVRKQAAQVDLLKDNHVYSLKQISPVRDQLSTKRLIKLYGAGIAGVIGSVVGLIFLIEKRKSLAEQLAPSVAAVTAPTALASPVPLAVPVSTPAATAFRRTTYAPPFESLGGVPEFLPSRIRRDNSSLVGELFTHHQPNSEEAESFRSLAASMLSRINDPRQVIPVISPETGDGKSTLASNLAIALAQSGKQVLVIDGDLGAPSLHTLFGIRNEIGLSEVAAREVDLLTAARQTVVTGLSILTAGGQSGAADMAAWDLRPVIDEARREFDVVLIDTPSLMSSSFGSALTRLASAAVFVWRPTQSNSDSVRRAAEILTSNGSPILGAIANRSREAQPQAVVANPASVPVLV